MFQHKRRTLRLYCKIVFDRNIHQICVAKVQNTMIRNILKSIHLDSIDITGYYIIMIQFFLEIIVLVIKKFYLITSIYNYPSRKIHSTVYTLCIWISRAWPREERLFLFHLHLKWQKLTLYTNYYDLTRIPWQLSNPNYWGGRFEDGLWIGNQI